MKTSRSIIIGSLTGAAILLVGCSDGASSPSSEVSTGFPGGDSPPKITASVDSDRGFNVGKDGIQAFSSAIRFDGGVVDILSVEWTSASTGLSALQINPGQRHWEGSPRDVVDNRDSLPVTLDSTDGPEYLGFAVLTETGGTPSGKVVVRYTSEGEDGEISAEGRWE